MRPKRKRFLYSFPETGYRYSENELFKLVDAYPTCVEGLIATRALVGKGWRLTHKLTGLAVGKQQPTLRRIYLMAGVLSAVDGWSIENRDEIVATVLPTLKEWGIWGWLYNDFHAD